MDTEQLAKVDAWLRAVLWEHALPHATAAVAPFEIHRLKGRLVFRDGKVKMIQGVQEIFEILDSIEESMETSAQGKIVVIGRHVRDVDFVQSFATALER